MQRTKPKTKIKDRKKLLNQSLQILIKYTQALLFNWKICFHVFNILTYDKLLCTLKKLIKLFRERPLLTSQFDVSKLHKQLGRVIQIHFDQYANFDRLPLIVSVTVSHSMNC